MELSKLNRDLSLNLLNDFYLFQGVEGVVRDVYIDKICKTCGRLENKIKVDKLEEALNPKGLFNKNIYIVVDDKELLENPKLWGRLKSYKGTPIIIYFNSLLDKRTKFYKEFSNDIVNFNYLSLDLLVEYTQGMLYNGNDTISKENAIKLVTNCNNNYGYIINECEKIKDYSKIHKLSPNLAFFELLDNGGIVIEGKVEFLNFVDYLLSGNIVKVFEYLPKINKDENIKNLSTLYTMVKSEYIVLTTTNPTPSNTGLSMGLINNIKNRKHAFSIEELEYTMRVINNVIKSIKEGKIPNDIALDCVVTKIF